MKKKELIGKRRELIYVAAITAALILLLFYFWFGLERHRTLLHALRDLEGDPILFSEESGFFTEGFSLKLKRNPAIPENIEIHYTINGDEPTEQSPLYDGGIDLSAVIRIQEESHSDTEAVGIEATGETAETTAGETATGETAAGESAAGETAAAETATGETTAADTAKADTPTAETTETEKEEEIIPSIEESRAAWRKEKAELVSDDGVRAEPAQDGITVIPIRACLIQGEDRSRTVTRTYVIGSGVFERYSAYVACLTTDSYNLFDYDNGIMIKGSHYQKDIDSGVRPDRSGNFYHTGDEWVKNGHVTLFSPNGEVLLEEDAGLSVAGFSSRNLPTRSLRAEASVDFGSSDNVFHLGPFFEGSRYGAEGSGSAEEAENSSAAQSAGTEDPSTAQSANAENSSAAQPAQSTNAENPSAAQSFEKVKFRTHGAPQIHIRAVRNEYAKILSDECGFPGLTENRLGAAYLNGEFYTICDIAPSATNNYLCQLFGLNVPDALEMFEGNDYDVFTRSKILRLLNADLTKEENCSRLEEAVDMDNYLFYYALEVLMNNSDWPFNNFSMWRYLGEKDPANPYTDGRFRFLLDDLDQLLTNNLHSMPEHWSTEVFGYLMKDEKSTFHHVMDCKRYRDTFLTYIEDLLQTAFEPEHGCAILDSLYAQMEKEYRLDYGDDFWAEMLTTAEITKANAREKESLLREDIEKYLNLKDRYTVRIEAGEGVCVTWNNDCGTSPDKKIQCLQPGENWKGSYYTGTSFTAEAAAAKGYRFAGWELDGVLKENPLEDTPDTGLKQDGKKRGSEAILISDALRQSDSDAVVTVRAVAEPVQ